MQASEKNPQDIDKLRISDVGLDKVSAPSHKKSLKSLSVPAALEILIFLIIFKTLSSEALFKQKSSAIVKHK